MGFESVYYGANWFDRVMPGSAPGAHSHVHLRPELLFEREQWAKYRALERILGHPDGAVLYAKSEGIGMGELAARMCMRGSDLVKG